VILTVLGGRPPDLNTVSLQLDAWEPTMEYSIASRLHGKRVESLSTTLSYLGNYVVGTRGLAVRTTSQPTSG
jgi:hypothetical protein